MSDLGLWLAVDGQIFAVVVVMIIEFGVGVVGFGGCEGVEFEAVAGGR